MKTYMEKLRELDRLVKLANAKLEMLANLKLHINKLRTETFVYLCMPEQAHDLAVYLSLLDMGDVEEDIACVRLVFK